ncbi:hypothetical protein MMC25_007668 [Agyrium rufum]|nr:hypothetical protein [Agyrium rufum]
METSDGVESRSSFESSRPSDPPIGSMKRSHDGAVVGHVRRTTPSALLTIDQIEVKEAWDALRKIIDGIGETAAGTFATSGALPNAANPGLYITGLGGIGLPLSKNDAERLARMCHRAPFGKGTETIADTKVRNTWELNPTQFKLENPA